MRGRLKITDQSLYHIICSLVPDPNNPSTDRFQYISRKHLTEIFWGIIILYCVFALSLCVESTRNFLTIEMKHELAIQLSRGKSLAL